MNLLCDIELKPGRHLRVTFKRENDQCFVDLRRWSKNAEGELAETSKGVTIPLAHVPAVIQALEQAQAQADNVVTELRKRTPSFATSAVCRDHE